MTAKVWPHPIKAVLFDNDGVIVDTCGIYYKINGQLIGKEYPAYMKERTNGRTDLDVCSLIIEEFGLKTTPAELSAKRLEMLKHELPNCTVIPGVKRIIETLKAKNIPISVATSARREAHELKAKNHRDIYDLFNADICGDEVTKAKPSPEIFQKASQKLGNFKPENVLVFEDAPLGIRAANDASMPSVLLWRRDTSPDDLLKEAGSKPTTVIHSFDDFDFDWFIWE